MKPEVLRIMADNDVTKMKVNGVKSKQKRLRSKRLCLFLGCRSEEGA